MDFSTIAIHGGQHPDPLTGAIMPPVYMTSTYVQEYPAKHKGYEYSRTDNPTRTALQDNLAALEGGTRALCFASGLAATTAVLPKPVTVDEPRERRESIVRSNGMAASLLINQAISR